MHKIILGSLLYVLLCLLSIGANATISSSPEQLVKEFQLLPHYDLFCRDERWREAVPRKVDNKFKTYFSKELFKLFMWAQCFEPDVPPSYFEIESNFSYDVRFSIPSGNLRYADSPQIVQISNFKIQKIKNQNPDKGIVVVNFNYDGTKMSTRYTLIQEDGQWKIDDISPRSTFVGKREPSDPDGNEIAEYSFSSDSIKAEMQKNHNAAMARYNKEQAQKGISPK